MVTVVGILGAAGIAPAAILRPALRRDDSSSRPSPSPPSPPVRDARGVRVTRFAIEAGPSRPVRHRASDDSYAELVADPRIDLVYNALPPSLHARVDDRRPGGGPARALREAVRDERRGGPSAWSRPRSGPGSRAIEAFHDHYHPLSGWVRRFLAEDGLGPLHRAEAVFTGANAVRPHRRIRHDPALGGGALMDLGCYPVHWLRAGLGAEPDVRQAQAVLNPLGADLAMEADLAVPGRAGGPAGGQHGGGRRRWPPPSRSRASGACCTSTTSCSRPRGTAS